MALRNGHGHGTGAPRIEVLPPDELPRGVPAPPSPARSAKRVTSRRSFGAVPAGTPEARELARKGALARWAKARQLRALEGLGLRGAAPAALSPYLEDAEQFAQAEVARLAQTVGGGVCAGAPATMVQSAALQLAGSRAAFASGDLALGSRLADASRQNLLAAFELTAREAKARPPQREAWWDELFGGGSPDEPERPSKRRRELASSDEGSSAEASDENAPAGRADGATDVADEGAEP